MELKILGSFEVSHSGRIVELGGYKRRAALAILALSANRVVSTDQLIEELWGENPPGEATGTLQAYISHLRRALEPDRGPREPPSILLSRSGGYVLAVDPDDVDATRFEHRTSEGRGLLRHGHARAAREALTEALDLWRGPALVDFVREPFARSEAARLEELRAAALEDRIAADLALGDHTAVVAEVQRLIAREPLREQLWAHLMLALYRCGRQGDALDAYQRCRQALDAELGLEPSPALRKLQSDLLRQDPSLDWQATETAGSRRSTTPDDEADRGPASLVFHDVSGRARAFLLEERGSSLTVGRESGADIWLSWDDRVSRHHAELELEGDRWVVIDDGMSSNGSFVNGERVDGRRVLQHGDELRFADTTLVFRSSAEGAAETLLDE